MQPDYIAMFQPMITALWYLIPIAILISITKTPWFKGVLGEWKMRILFAIKLPKEKYRLINNVTLCTDDGGTTQIDHIIVSQYGLFVIETKNMRGWIFGGERQKTWTQKIFKRSSKFQNPLHQNYKHIKAIEAQLDVDSSLLHSIVTFVGDSTFKTDMPANVINPKSCVALILSKTDILLDEADVIEIFYAINQGRLEESWKTHQEHVAHVKTIIAKKENDDKICPKCGFSMVLRKSKRGKNKGLEFWGCSAYPKCRTIQSVEE